MLSFLVNTLSAHHQFVAIEELECAVVQIIDCFKTVEPALSSGAIRILYDDKIELRGLLLGSESVRNCLGKLGNADLRRQWYLYTKNRSARAEMDGVDLSLEAGGEILNGLGSLSFLNERHLIGFCGTPACEAALVDISTPDIAPRTINKCTSTCSSAELWRLLPRYERSPKHRAKPYLRADGEIVSPMTVDDDSAQLCLLNSVDVGGHRYGKHANAYIKFMLTRADNNGSTFHGFEIDREDVPSNAIAILDLW